MGQEGQEKARKKEAMQKLREARKHTIKAATARMKEQKKAIDSIKEELQAGERTVPEIAAATGLPASEVLWYVASLKKYGEILEGPEDGSYYRYRLGQGAGKEAEPGPGEE
jgi:Fic family protein